MRVTPRGVGRCTGPAISVTAAPSGSGGIGQRETHFTAGTIGDETDGVDGFLGRTGGDQKVLAIEILRVERREHSVDDAFRIGQASGSDFTTGQIAGIGLDDQVAALPQQGHIGLCGGMRPHLFIHRGSQRHTAGEGEVRGSEEIAGQAVSEVSEEVGGGGGHQEDLILSRDGDMLHRAGQVSPRRTGGGEERSDDFLSGESGEGERRYEFARRVRHDDADFGASLDEEAGYFRGLVRRDSASDA